MRHTTFLAMLMLALSFCFTAYSQEYTSIEDLKKNDVDWRDYQIQGEYLYKAGDKVFAVQVIANGDGKFTLVGFPGGFPGQGWLPGQYRIVFQGAIEGDEVVLKPVYMQNAEKWAEQIEIPEKNKGVVAKINVKEPKIVFITPNKPDRIAEKFQRPNPAMGMACPEDGIMLYDGTSKDKTNTDMLASFREINKDTGAMFSEFVTKDLEKGKPYMLHLEFMTSFMPRAEGQARSNSGVYLNQCYECQVLDSFGLRGENNECGGFYQQLRPAVNACMPPLTWQSYDFIVYPPKFDAEGKKVQNAKVTVAHNGILIHKDCELKHETPGCKGEADEPRAIYLQGHGNNVQYRNIWVQYWDEEKK